MKRYLQIFLALFIILNSVLFAQKGTWKTGNFHIDLSGQFGNAPSYNDHNGNRNIEIKDSNASYDRRFFFENNTSIFNLNLEYGINERFKVNLELPFAYYSLTETFKEDENYAKSIRFEKSKFKIAYYGIGAKYLLLNDNFYSYASLDMRLPQGFKNADLTVKDSSFERDGVFEYQPGLQIGYKFKESWLQSGFAYIGKSGLMVDQMLINFEVGLNSVANTYLKGMLNYYKPVKPFDDSTKFLNMRKMPLQEEYLQFGVAFDLKFSKDVNSTFSYYVNIWGNNNWNTAAFKVLLGINLN